jgi:chromosomal replication initiation ATPase DnaA
MVIRESGLLFRGLTLVSESYYETAVAPIDPDLRSGLLTALLNFAETTFEEKKIEYIEGAKFVIAFMEDMIEFKTFLEPLIVYVILDKEKKIEKYVRKIVQPLLKKVAERFKTKYKGENLLHVSQFTPFKGDLRDIFGTEIKKIDDRLDKLFY